MSAGGVSKRRADLAWTLLVVFLVIASATMLALAICGWFHWTLALAIALPLSAAAAWRCLQRQSLLDSGGVWYFLVAAILASPLYAHPHEYLSGWDPGIYLSTGSMLARSGSLTLHETPPWQELSPAQKILFHDYHRDTRHSGFRDGEAPNFLHLYPAWIASFVQIGGPRAGLWVNPVFGLLVTVLVFALALALTGEKPIAWITALLLLLNINHIYFARFSTAEMVGTAVLAAAALAIVQGWRRSSPFWLALGGSAFVLTATAKIDVLPFVVLFLGALTVYAAVRSDPRTLWLGGASLISLLLLVIYYRLEAWEYVLRVFALFHAGGGAFAGAVGLVAAAFLFAVFAVKKSVRSALEATIRRLGNFFRVGKRGPLTLALLAAAGVVLYRVRTSGQPHLWDRWAIFAWLFTPAGLLLLAAGCLLWLRRAAPATAARIGVVAAAGVIAIITMSDPVWGNEPLHFWISRRLELILLPVCCLFIATALARLGAAFRGSRLLAVSLLLLVVVVPLRGASAWLGKADQAGLFDLGGRLAAQVGPGDLVVCDRGWMAAPLRFFWGVETFALQLDRDPAEALVVIDRWESGGRRVFYLTTGDAPVYHPERDFALRFSEDFLSDALERPSARLPRERQADTLGVRLYEILRTPPLPAFLPSPTWIPIGNDFFGLGEGFDPPQYFKVGARRVYARSCRGRGVIHLPLPPADGAPWRIRLRVDDLRPAPGPALQLRLSLDGRDLGTRVVAAGAQVLDFALPENRNPPGRSPGVGRLALEFSEQGSDGAPSVPVAMVVEGVLLMR